jgi:hypothetical protein
MWYNTDVHGYPHQSESLSCNNATSFHEHTQGDESSPATLVCGDNMEFVTVSTRLWKDRWIRTIEPKAKLFFLYLATSEVSDHGFYEYDPEGWALETGLSARMIARYTEQFISAGKVLRDGDLILVLKALTHQRLSPTNYASAINNIRRRYAARSEQLVLACIRANPQSLTGTSCDSQGVTVTSYLSQSVSQSQSQSESESKSNTTLFAQSAAQPEHAAPKRSKASPARKRTPEPEQYVQLATELDYFIRLCIAKYNIPHGPLLNDPQRCAQQLRLLCELDGYAEESIFPALLWAWGYTFSGNGGVPVNYGAVMTSIVRWRPEKFGKMYTQWLHHTNGDLREGASTRREIQKRLAITEVTA